MSGVSWVAHAGHYDVLVVGSGFGGSVTALRLTEKGYRVGVLEAGRRWADEDFPKTSWDLKKFIWAPKLGCKGIQRIHALPDILVLAGAGVGGGALNYANTLYEPKSDSFYRDRQWAHITDWRSELAPFYDQAKRMLAVVTNPTMTPSDEVIQKVAEQMGVGDTFGLTPVGVFFGRDGDKEPGVEVDDPHFGGAGHAPRLHRVRRVHDRLPARREEHAGQELPLPGGEGGRTGAPRAHGHRRPAAGARWLRRRLGADRGVARGRDEAHVHR